MRIMTLGSPDTDETRMIVDAARERGHEAYAGKIYDLYFEVKDSVFKAYHREVDLLSYDAFIFRGISSSTPEKSQLFNALILARYLYDNGKIVLDEKLATDRVFPTKIPYTRTKNGVSVPDTVFTLGENVTKKYLKNAQYPLIIKSITGSKGRGVFLAQNYLEAKKIISENDQKRFMFQEYIPTRFDVRIFIVNGKIMGAMRRDAADGDFRSNIAQGGSSSIFDLSQRPDVSELALKAFKAANMEVAGVDIMINNEKLYVLEVNRAPQFKGFYAATGINVAVEIVKYLEDKYQKNIAK